jgi:hypothetical protein
MVLVEKSTKKIGGMSRTAHPARPGVSSDPDNSIAK